MILRKQFDPKKFIDREFEQELFEELLAFQDEARILAIQDASGMGKSHLLELFRYRCRTVRPRTPVSLIDLKQLPDQSPMMFVKEVVKDLADLDVPFPNFNAYESARVSADFDFFRASVYLQGASFKEPHDRRTSRTMPPSHQSIRNDAPNQGGQGNFYGPVAFNQQQTTFTTERVHITHSRGELTGEQLEKAEDVCVRSFLDDVRAHCAAQPVVLLIDSFEKCGDRLRLWLRDHFLEHYFFDPAKRPAKLLLVVAGQTLPNFAGNWSVEDCERTLKSVEALNRWTREHVEQCLKVHGFPYEEQDIDTFHRLVELGLPPSQVVQAIETVLTQKGVA
jgi:hypothetical protein